MQLCVWCSWRGGRAGEGSGPAKDHQHGLLPSWRWKECGPQGQVRQVAVGNRRSHVPAGSGGCPRVGSTRKVSRAQVGCAACSLGGGSGYGSDFTSQPDTNSLPLYLAPVAPSRREEFEVT